MLPLPLSLTGYAPPLLTLCVNVGWGLSDGDQPCCRGDHWSPACRAYCPTNGRGDPSPTEVRFCRKRGHMECPLRKKGSLTFSCGRRGTAERWMRSRRAQSYSFHSVIRFHTRFFFERAPGKPKPFGFSRSEKLRSTVGALVYRVLRHKRKWTRGNTPCRQKENAIPTFRRRTY